MPVTVTSVIEAQLVSGTWTDLSADVLNGVTVRRGIQGNGPRDGSASTGELRFDLNNSAQNAGGILGWYSPAHASKRTGWGYGIPLRWYLTYVAAAAVTSITRALTTVTVTTTAPHGLTTGMWAKVAGAVQTDYNGVWQVTVTGASTFTYAVTTAPVTPATGTLTWQRAHVQFRGKVGSIMPDAGQHQNRRVHVVGYDPIRDLMEADIREVSVQTNQTESQLLTTIINALPVTAQPPAVDFDAGLDTYPYAFDDLGPGARAATLANDIVLSGLGAFFATGDGTLRYVTRRNRALAVSGLTLSNAMVELLVPSTLDGVFNRVRTTIHPKTIDAAATTVLWAQTGEPPSISPGDTITLWGTYYQTGVQERLIGGTQQVTPIVATTDYLGNAASDGSGADLTADLSIVTTPFASTVKYDVTNTGAAAVYLTKLQIRGKGVYDNGPRTLESYVAADYGDRPIEIDLPYQDDPYLGQDLASYIRAQYDGLESMVESVEFIATTNTTMLGAALSLEPTDVITLTETVSGLSGTDAIVQSVELTLVTSQHLRCRYLLAPAAPFAFWSLGTAGASELGETTVLGF